MKSYIVILAFASLLGACNNTPQTTLQIPTEPTQATAEHQHEKEENTAIVAITTEQMEVVGITLGSLEQKQLTATLKTTGTLSVPNNNKANVTSLYGGVIKTLTVQIGGYVKKGQTVATIANPQFIQLQEEYLTLSATATSGSEQSVSTIVNPQYGALKLDLDAVLPQIEYAQLELTRQHELFAGNAGAQKNVQAAEGNLKALQAKKNTIESQMSLFKTTANVATSTRLASVTQQLQLMGLKPANIKPTNLTNTISVLSPISGTVSNVFSKIGSYVDVSSPVAEIVDNSQLHVDLDVFEKDLPMLKVGQVIHFTLTNNAIDEYDAKIFSIGSAFQNDSKTIPIHAAVKGNKTGLIDGMNITAVVSLNNITAPVVPNDAIINNGNKDYLFVVTDKHADEHHNEKNEEPVHGKKAIEATTNFEKVEIIKGISDMGYTAVTFINEVPTTAKIATKGAFFINAKLTNTEGHVH